MDIPASISKQSQESWEENLWYDKPTPPSKRTSAASARTQGSQVPDKEVGAGHVSTGPSEPLKTAERAHTIKRAKSTTSSTKSPTTSPPLDSSAWESGWRQRARSWWLAPIRDRFGSPFIHSAFIIFHDRVHAAFCREVVVQMVSGLCLCHR